MQEIKSQNAKEIINRLKSVLNIESDGDLAVRLGVRQSTLSTWRARDTLDYPLVLSLTPSDKLRYVLRGELENDVSQNAKHPTQSDSDLRMIIEAQRTLINDLQSHINNQKVLIAKIEELSAQNTGQKKKGWIVSVIAKQNKDEEYSFYSPPVDK